MSTEMLWLGIGMLVAYIVMSMPYESSKKHSMMAAQCYAYNDETQQWDRLRNGQR